MNTLLNGDVLTPRGAFVMRVIVSILIIVPWLIVFLYLPARGLWS